MAKKFPLGVRKGVCAYVCRNVFVCISMCVFAAPVSRDLADTPLDHRLYLTKCLVLCTMCEGLCVCAYVCVCVCGACFVLRASCFV